MSFENLPDATIAPGCRVTLHFSLALPGGESVDSTFGKKPASFTVGDGSLLPGFERRILGLMAGDKVDTVVPVAEAFGERNPDNLQSMARERFNRFLDDEYDALRPGTVLAFKDPGGFDLPGVINEITPAAVVVDFNHPLAGRDICFRAEILAVIPADTQRLDIKI